MNFIAFAQYRPGRKLPMDIYSVRSLVRNPPPYFHQTYRIVFSCFSSCGSYYGSVRYVDAKGLILDGDRLRDQAQNNAEALFLKQLWKIVAFSLINFERDAGFLHICSPKRRSFFSIFSK